MKLARIMIPALLSAACATSGANPSPRASDARAALRFSIDSMVRQTQFRDAQFGVLIVDPERGDTLYSLNAGKLFMPASNMKIVTGATSLVELGPDYTFHTDFVAGGPRIIFGFWRFGGFGGFWRIWRKNRKFPPWTKNNLKYPYKYI